MIQKQNHTDIITKGWVEYIPSSLRPYFYLMRLDRPIGTWLLLLPSLWAILLTGGIAAWPMMTLFAIGSLIMRGAGCVINDLWDTDLDSKVERTKTRPLPAKHIQQRQAVLFLSGLLLLGFLILLQFNILTVILGIISLFFVGSYPYMKRITWWPQAFLGLTFNFGALMGWAAVTGELPWQAWTLYVAGFFWTLLYDTIYAMQDREDDMMVGIKSSARFLVERYPNHLSYSLYGFAVMHYGLLISVIASMITIPLWLMPLFLLPAMHLIWQVKTLNIHESQNALTRFKSNRDYGVMVCLFIIVIGIGYFHS